jgi:glycosyltransferase involved in cell wall biosynthesis
MNAPIYMSNVSVIIPVWNAEPYLRRCLDSVINQTLRDIEIICVNDGSTDGSLEILNEYAARDSRMRVVSLAKNSGESVARNTGLAMVRGEYTGFVDNDDAVDLDFYEKLYDKAKETDADIVKGSRLQIDYDGKINEININKLVSKNKAYFFSQWWTAIYKTSLIKNNNITFPNDIIVGGDSVFQVNAVIYANTVEIINNIFYHYYRRKDSGNAQVLIPEKVFSYIRAMISIIKLINSLYKIIISEEQYDIIFSNCFLLCIHIILRPVILDIEIKDFRSVCANLLLEIYYLSKRPENIDKNFRNSCTYLLKLLAERDTDGLEKYMKNNTTFFKMLAYESRKRLSCNKA